MAKLKHQFRNKEEVSAYEGLILTWPCADEISSKLFSMIYEDDHKQMLTVFQKAIAAYNQPYPFYMNDWERLAVYLIITVNYVSKTLRGKMSFADIVSACSLPRKMTLLFIEDTAKKLCMEIEHA